MPHRGRHCPFLNRDDERCSSNFHVGNLSHTFEHCFDAYTTCPTYLELLLERRVKRVAAAAVMGTFVGSGEGASDGLAGLSAVIRAIDERHGRAADRPTRGELTPLTVHGRAVDHAGPAAVAAA
jgi:hypothetical protein